MPICYAAAPNHRTAAPHLFSRSYVPSPRRPTRASAEAAAARGLIFAEPLTEIAGKAPGAGEHYEAEHYEAEYATRDARGRGGPGANQLRRLQGHRRCA